MTDASTGDMEPNDKVCFVTTGATAPFTGLIESVLSPSSIGALREQGYTRLLIQYGTAKQVMDNHAKAARERLQAEDISQPLAIEGFDFDREGLKTQFKLVRQTNGLAISHAGMLHVVELRSVRI